MALDMSLELEGEAPDWRACIQAARLTGVTSLTSEEGHAHRFEGQFARSWVVFWTSRRDTRPWVVTAEGDHGCDFTRLYTIVFRLNNSRYDESVADLRDFLTHLAELSSMQFVLSFQGEQVYAIRDHERGFEFFWDSPR
jgi:hypothetical protein